MLKSLRKFNKNVFVYHIKEGVISRYACVDREGGIKGGDMYARSHVRGMCVDREGGIKGGGCVCALACEGCG